MNAMRIEATDFMIDCSIDDGSGAQISHTHGQVSREQDDRNEKFIEKVNGLYTGEFFIDSDSRLRKSPSTR